MIEMNESENYLLNTSVALGILGFGILPVNEPGALTTLPSSGHE